MNQKIAENDFFRIVCIGDGQTAQVNSILKWSDWIKRGVAAAYENQKKWRFQLFNTAVEGATPQHIATYLSHYALQFKPDLVIVSFGHFPLDQMFNESAFIAEFTMLMQSLNRASVPIALWSPAPQPSGAGREAILSVATFFEQIARTSNAEYVDVRGAFEEYELARLFKDQQTGATAELNNAGNFLIAKTLVSSLFDLSLPSVSEGEFEVPQLEQLKKWTA